MKRVTKKEIKTKEYDKLISLTMVIRTISVIIGIALIPIGIMICSMIAYSGSDHLAAIALFGVWALAAIAIAIGSIPFKRIFHLLNNVDDNVEEE